MGSSVKAIPRDKIERLIMLLYAVHAKYGVLLRLGIETGIRISDLLQLRVGHFKACMRVQESKTKKIKECRLSDELVQEIQEYIKEQRLTDADALFYSTEHLKNKPLTRVRVWQVFKAVSDEMKLDAVRPHSMRKTFAEAVMGETGSILAVQHALGHKNIETTMRYLFDFKQLEERLKNA
jgi:integrase